jgi:hypothetical protein
MVCLCFFFKESKNRPLNGLSFNFCLEFGVYYVVFGLPFNFTFGRWFIIRFRLLLRILRRLRHLHLFF